MSGFDWDTWAKNYPPRVHREQTVAGIPPLITLQRAGDAVSMTPEELTAALAELGYELRPASSESGLT